MGSSLETPAAQAERTDAVVVAEGIETIKPARAGPPRTCWWR
jgi:hypothetical protein